MSLFTRRGRVDVSTSDSEINSVASSGDQSPDEVVEKLARMALAGHYYASPKIYETNEMLRGHGLARRPRASDDAAPAFASSSNAPSTVGPSPPLSPRSQPRSGAATASLLPYSNPSSRASAAARGRSPPLLQRALQKSRAALHDLEAVEAGKAADISRALERMYRHLAREYAAEIRKEESETPGTSGRNGVKEHAVATSESDGVANNVGEKPKPRNKRRPPDELARARLLAKSKMQELRQAIPYHKVKEREEEARKNPKQVRVPQKAVILGRRLYLEAQEKRRTMKEMQEELEKQKAEEERKMCTFHPSISRYAERLAGVSGHYTIGDRLADHAIHDEELQRLRFERTVELEKECTFQPQLSKGTEELVAHQFCRRSLSRRKRQSQSSFDRCCNLSSSALSHEPFEPGERLYRDGAERLLRQQIRLRRAAARQQHHVVGGQLRLSSEKTKDLAHRFEVWAAAREKRQIQLRDEVYRQGREGSNAAVDAHSARSKRTRATNADTTGSTRRVLSRSPSAKSASTARPNNSPFISRDENNDVSGQGDAGNKNSNKHNSNGAAHSTLLAQLVQGNCLPLSVPHPSAPNSNAFNTGSAANSTRSRNSANVVTQEVYFDGHDDSFKTAPLANTAVRKEQLRIRLGALFFKYAVTPTSTTVSPAEVDQQVRCYYPEDAGVAAALHMCFDNKQQRLTKHEFMAALARYVAQSGPQPWCFSYRGHKGGNSISSHHVHMPTSDRASSTDGNTGVAASGTAAGDSSERLNTPTGFLGSPVRETQGAAAPPCGSVRSGAWTSTTGVTTPSQPTTPTRSIKQGNVEAVVQLDSIGVAVPSVDVSTSYGVALLTSSIPREQKPLRTHIYHQYCSKESVPAAPAAGKDVNVLAEEMREKAVRADSRLKVKEQASAYPEAAAAAKPKKGQPASRIMLPNNAPAAQLVHGYQEHVERHRRSIEQVKATADPKHTSEDDDAQCTFQPTLNRYSVVLSDMDVKKRMLYAHELQLRRQELQLLRESVLKAAGSTVAPSSPVVTHTSATPRASSAERTLSSSRKGTGNEKAGVRKGVLTPPRQRLTPACSSCGNGGKNSGSEELSRAAANAQSPSIDVSSPSSVIAKDEQSGETLSNKPSPARDMLCSPENKEAGGDAADSNHLGSAGVNKAPAVRSNTSLPLVSETAKPTFGENIPSSTPPEATVSTHVSSVLRPQSTASCFRATKPDRAIFACDDALTPCRSDRMR